MSSLSSLVLSITVARAVGADAFGAFTVAFAVYSVGVLVSRALVSQPLPIRYSAAEPGPFRRAAGASVGAATAVGLGAGVVVAVIGLALGGSVGLALASVGLLFPGLLVQDAWRMAFFASGRPQWAAVIDGVWMVLQVLSVVLLVLIGTDSVVLYLFGWGLAALAGAVLGSVGGRTAPRLDRTAAWVREHWGLTRFLLVESIIVQGAFQGSLLLVGALGTLSDVAALRGAQVVVGPVSLLAMSASAFAVPELARRAELTGRRGLRISIVAGAALALLGATWGTLVLLLPDVAGEAVLGASWVEVQPVLLATVVGQTINLFSAGATFVVYSRGETAAALRINVVVAAALPGFGLIGLYLFGVDGVAWGYAMAYACVVPFWYHCVRRIVRRHRAAAGASL